jgi:threonine/homoserine/homoserine lactone efflux protein
MDISLIDWIAFFAAALYLLLVPGYGIVRTLGWDAKLRAPETIAVAFGISASILVVVATLLALPFSIGLNFYTLVILETLIIVLTTKEVIDYVKATLKI